MLREIILDTIFLVKLLKKEDISIIKKIINTLRN